MEARDAGRLAGGLADLALPAALAGPLAAYADLLVRWGRRYNLVAAGEDLVCRHLLDSLAVLPWIDADPVLDVGSGAGLPGIPLALALPARRFVLLDANSKRTRFLEQARIELALGNVEVVHSRIEDYRPAVAFPLAVSRAVAALADLYAGVAHCLAPGGRLLALKGPAHAGELAALAAQGVPATAHRLAVPGTAAGRWLVVAGGGAPAGTVQ